MRCPNKECHIDGIIGKFCAYCGVKLVEDKLCWCGAEVTGDKFCRECGQEVKNGNA